MIEQEHIATPEDDPIAWQRAHADHLRSDPYEICIPGFNGAAYAPVEVAGPGALDGLGDGSASRRAADWDCWPETTLVTDGTRAVVNVSELAHHRECAEASCITVWHKGKERQRQFVTLTFVFAPPPITAGRFTPTLVVVS